MTGAQEITVDLSQVYDPRRNPKQLLFHRAPETYKLYGGAMGGGKTAAIINEGLQLNLDFPGNSGLLVRKTWPSFRDTVLSQLEKFLDRRLVKSWNLTSKIIEMVNGSRIRYGGLGDDQDDWRNWMSGEYGWIALEQAEDFTETEFRMLSTRLRLRLPGIRYHFLLSCNPSLGWLKRLFLEGGLRDSVFVPALPRDNIANLPPDYIPRMEAILDENQRKALLKGDWEAVGAPDDVYGYERVRAAMGRKVKATEPVEIGVDVARFGDDETVIVLREGLLVQIFGVFRGHDTMKTCGEVWRCIRDEIAPWWKAIRGQRDKLTVRVKIDADGVGGGVVDRLREIVQEQAAELEGWGLVIEVLEIHGSAAPKDKTRFKNLRAEMHWALREILDDAAIPDDPELQAQLLAIKHRRDSAGRVEIVPKDDIKKVLGRSPDRAEGVIYALAQVEPSVGWAFG